MQPTAAYTKAMAPMLSIFVFIVLFSHNVIGFALPTVNVDLVSTAAVKAPLITPSPPVPGAQELASISASISSLVALLQPPSSITSELSAFPTAVLSALEGPNVMSAFDQLYAESGMPFFTSLPSGAESWVLGLPAQAATILPQVISLQSFANNALLTSSSSSTIGLTSEFSTTPTATVTATGKRNGLTEGQQIGTIVGAVAFFVSSIAIGLMVYDDRRKKALERERLESHRQSQLVNAPVQLPQQCPRSVATTAELGTIRENQDGSETHEPVYELHSPAL